MLNICGGCCNARLRSGCLSSLGGEAEEPPEVEEPEDVDLLFVSLSEELRGLEQTLLFVLLGAGCIHMLDSTPESVDGESVLRIWLYLRLLTLAEVTETVETVAAIGQ